MIFANHAHISPEEIKPSATLEKLKIYLDECGIDKCVAFAPFQDRLNESNFGQNANEWLAKEIKGEADIVGFGTIDFEAGKLSEQVERAADLGLKGLKLHPPYQEFVVDGEEAFEVYAKAQELGLFLSFHTGLHWHRLRDNHPLLFDEVAFNFQSLRFSMEHIGGYSFFNDALAVMNNNKRGEVFPRVYAGWTTIGNSGGNGAWSISDEQLETLIFQTGEESSIFGLDFPFNSPESIRSDIERIKNLNISAQAKENILYNNLAKAIGI